MIVYLGNTRSKKLIALFNSLGFGECTQRGELPPVRTPWFFDNGAFVDYKNGSSFSANEFSADLEIIRGGSVGTPDFIVLPDIVAGGIKSLELSVSWIDRIPSGIPKYLAVQDGMGAEDIYAFEDSIDGIFVGGTTSYKLKTGEMWCAISKTLGLKSHIGRCGTSRRVLWARRIGADSIDSCLPLWSAGHLRKFIAALYGPHESLSGQIDLCFTE